MITSKEIHSEIVLLKRRFDSHLEKCKQCDDYYNGWANDSFCSPDIPAMEKRLDNLRDQYGELERENHAESLLY